MYEGTYDIIDWKSCESGSEDCSEDDSSQCDDNDDNIDGRYLAHTAGGSNSDQIVFPTLFYEAETETSIVTLPDAESDYWRSETHEGVPDDIEQLSVYQKVANWVFTQKVFFRKEEEHVIEDDDLEVIDPVDLFHESILDDYLLVAEHDVERRAILRDLSDNQYEIESVQELMQTHEYKFLREPKGDVELELEHIVRCNDPVDNATSKKKFRRKNVSECSSPDMEGLEENILFLGVPRLLENYVILNREGYVVKLDEIPDLWLSPFEEDLNNKGSVDEGNQSELEFLSSWFSDVYQTDVDTSERKQTVTDMDKLTLISVGSDDEVWLDAPEIPHWLDEEPEELELFNQPSKPLYYYRDRIKGCYRIIGVEDETVVLFSGNDDDTIFYTEENSFQPISTLSDNDERSDVVKEVITSVAYPGWSSNHRNSFVSKYRRFYNRLRYGVKYAEEDANDGKNDSGIDEDIDEHICEEVTISPFPFSNKESSFYPPLIHSRKRPSFSINPMKESFAECLFVVMGACIVLISLVMYKNDNPLFQPSSTIFIY